MNQQTHNFISSNLISFKRIEKALFFTFQGINWGEDELYDICREFMNLNDYEIEDYTMGIDAFLELTDCEIILGRNDL